MELLTECYNQACFGVTNCSRQAASFLFNPMRANGIEDSGTSENPVQHQSELVFNRMNRYIRRLAKDAKANDVHRFRTNSRRVEALVDELAPENSNTKKLLKVLSKLRKKAGKVRDLDVQIAFLKQLKIPDRHNHRAQLLEALQEEQVRRSKKLTKSFDNAKMDVLRKRLLRAKSDIKLDGIDPLKLAFNRLPKLATTPTTEKMLHACRIVAKRARYLAELAGDASEAKTVIAELKRAQDEIGRWHDVLKLSERAERLFGAAHDSSLVAALQNISRASFRRAANTLQAALKAIAEGQKGAAHPPAKTPAAEAVPAARSAAA
jgi:CHAD domain-containing protein